MEINNQNSIPVAQEKIFSNGNLWFAAIIGGPLVVGILASENYKIFGEKKNAFWMMFAGIFFMVVICVLAYFNIPKGNVSISYLIGFLLAVPQQNQIKSYIANGGQAGRRWPASAIIIVVLLILSIIVSIYASTLKQNNLESTNNSLSPYVQSVSDNIEKRDYVAAIADFDKMLQTNPTDPKTLAAIYGGKAEVEYLNGNTIEAENDYKKSISIYPVKIYYRNLAQIYSDKNEYLLAIDNLNKGIELDPSNKDKPSNEVLLMSSALMYFGLGDNNKVIEFTTKILQSNPEDPMNAYLNRGYAYSNLNKQELAISDYTSAINIRPTDQAYIARGNAYGILNNKVAACADLKQVKSVPIDPTFKSNHISLTAYCK